MRILLFLLACPLFAQLDSDASRLRGKPPCSTTVTTNCIPSADNSGVELVGGFPTGLSNRGNVFIPPDFPSMGVSFYRDAAGNYTSSFDPDTYATAMAVTKTIFVDVVNGNDSTGTGLTGAPYKTIAKGILAAQSAPDTSIQITVKTNGADQVFGLTSGGSFPSQVSPASPTISGKRLYITPDDTSKYIYVGSQVAGLSWTKTGGQTFVYQATTFATVRVDDIGALDANGIPTAYSLQTSIANVDANAGSYYVAANITYVHTLTGVAATNTTIIPNLAGNVQFTLDSAAEVYLRNFSFVLTGNDTGSAQLYVSGASSDYTNTRLTLYNCRFGNAGSTTIDVDGQRTQSVKQVQVFNTVSAYGATDAFSAHYDNVQTGNPTIMRTYWALYFNCLAYNQGIGSSAAQAGTDNAFTNHNGANIAVIASKGWNTNGPVLAMVNGSYSVVIGSSMRDSVRSAGATHAAYYFDNVPNPALLANAKVYIDDSIASDSQYDLNTDGTAMSIYLRNFAGTNIPVATYRNVLHLPSDPTALTVKQQAGVFIQSADPGCSQTAQVGRLWFDNTTTTTAFKVCTNVSGTVGWATK